MAPCCGHKNFSITNVKLTLKMNKLVVFDDNDPRILIHETNNIRIYHVNCLSLTVFRSKDHGFQSKYVHATGTSCYCEIEGHVLQSIVDVSNIRHSDCEYIRVGSISFTHKTRLGLKSRFLKMSPAFYQTHDVRIPRKFPGLVLKKLHKSTTGLLFNSGHLIGTGARRPQQIFEFIAKFNDLVAEVDALLASEG